MLAADQTLGDVPMPATPAPSPLPQPPANTPPGPSNAFAEVVNNVSATVNNNIVQEPYIALGGAVESRMDRSLPAVEVPAGRPALAERLEIDVLM
jgi:hypothetical protein